MPHPIDKNELVERLAPLVIPMIRDRAIIGEPIPGNNAAAGVRILWQRHSIVLSPADYEILRTEVLQYVQDRLGTHGSLMYTLGDGEVANLIKSRLKEVFLDA